MLRKISHRLQYVVRSPVHPVSHTCIYVGGLSSEYIRGDNLDSITVLECSCYMLHKRQFPVSYI